MKIKDIIQELKRFDFSTETNITGIRRLNGTLIFDIDSNRMLATVLIEDVENAETIGIETDRLNVKVDNKKYLGTKKKKA